MKTYRANPALKWVLAFLIGGPILLAVAVAILVASFFWVGPEVRALRNAVIENSNAEWKRVVELSFGRHSFGMASFASSFISEMPPEAHAALQSARQCEVSVYQLNGGKVSREGVLNRADEKMKESGWYRAVGVLSGDDTVAVYLPLAPQDSLELSACVLVLNKEQLVCVSAESNLEPLMQLAHRRLESNRFASLPKW